MSDIVETLKLMCDKTNPQDKKLLLLAELVENNHKALAAKQDSLEKQLSQTNEKMDKIMQLLEAQESGVSECPVYKDKQNFEKLATLMRYPKAAMFILIGILAILAGFVGSSLLDTLKLILGL